MVRLASSFALLTTLALALGLTGCGKSRQAPSKPSTPVTGSASVGDAVAEALAQLSDEDRAQAEAQKVCPVSEEPLGSMGKPVKVDLGERQVFICCDGCEDELRKNKDKYLAKLPQ